MKLITKKRINLLLVVLLLLLLGFYRDFLFKQVNALLKAWDYEMPYQMPAPWRFLENFHYDTVVGVKWILTLLFCSLFLLVSLLAIKTIFSGRRYLYITAAVYLAVIVFSGLVMLAGMLTGNPEKMYSLSHYLISMAQSPVLLMILIPAFKLSARERQNIGN